MPKKYRLGILISDDYSAFHKIKTIIHDAKGKLGNNLQICQISDNGKYSELKKFVLGIGIDYIEFKRYDEIFSIYSHDQNFHKFNRPFNGKYYYIRNNAFVFGCDGIFLFEYDKITRSQLFIDILSKIEGKLDNFKIFA